MAEKTQDSKKVTKIDMQDCCEKHYRNDHHGHHGNANGGGAVYGLGLIGAAIYFIGQTSNFQDGFIAFLKALVWPAYLVYDALKFFAR